MIKRPKRIATKPIYIGQRLDRVSKEVHICKRCDTLAAYRATVDHNPVPMYWFLCELHLNDAIKRQAVRRAIELPEYRKHLRRMQNWHAQQNAGEQEVLL